MNELLIQTILGGLTGLFFGMTGILPLGLLLVIFEFLKVGDYISNLGAMVLLYLLPISIGSFWNFFKADKINYQMGVILGLSIIIGSHFGSTIILSEEKKISRKTIKYMTAYLGLFSGVLFLYSAYYEKN
jgi:uncharacterized membrane protein YfcA